MHSVAVHYIVVSQCTVQNTHTLYSALLFHKRAISEARTVSLVFSFVGKGGMVGGRGGVGQRLLLGWAHNKRAVNSLGSWNLLVMHVTAWFGSNK